MKKFIIAVFVILLALSIGCADTKDNENKPTGTPAIRTEKPTEKPATAEPTAEPTPSPTKEPVQTVEPGKETYAGGIKDETKGVRYSFRPTNGKEDHRMISESLAAQFFATTAFSKIEVACPSYSDNEGTIVMELFKWQGTYEATIDREANPPVASIEHVDYTDNAMLALEFDPLPDGEYLLYLSTPDPAKQVGVWGNYDATNLWARAYADDEVWEGGGFGPIIYYTKTPNNMYGPIQEP